MLKVLIACENSGIVRDAFIEKGCEAWSCDLLPAKGNHLQGNAISFLEKSWDLMICHPPCTYLSSSGMHWTTRGLRDPRLTDNALAFVRALLAAPIPFIALENPVGKIGTAIRKADQIIQPYQFGHNASKRTCLWLKNLPKLIPTENIAPERYVDGKPRWGNQTASGQNKLGPAVDRWKTRSKTYSGIASAMAEQWTDFIISQKSRATLETLGEYEK